MKRLWIYESITTKAALGILTEPEAAALLPEGQAMLQAVRRDFALLPGIQLIDTTHIHFPKKPLQDYIEESLQETDFVLIIAPEINGELLQVTRQVEATGKNHLGCSSEVLELIGDKVTQAKRWLQLQVPHPRLLQLQVPLTYPVVAKLKQGAGSFRMRRFEQESELIAWCESLIPGEIDQFLFQEYRPGIAASLGFFVNDSQLIPLHPVLQKIEWDHHFRYAGGSLNLREDQKSRILKIARQALRGIQGMRGFIGVDVMLQQNGIDLAIEINPRLTTSYAGLRAKSRRNLAEIWWNLIQGKPVPTPEWLPKSVEFTENGIFL